jgi:hypothetical protein
VRNVSAKRTLNKSNKVFIEKLIFSSLRNSPLVWTPKVHRCIHKSVRDSLLRQFNQSMSSHPISRTAMYYPLTNLLIIPLHRFLLHARYRRMSCLSQLNSLTLITSRVVKAQIVKPPLCNFLHSPVTSSFLGTC